MISGEADWVRESRFGSWFLGTEVWFREVLCPSLDELERLIARRSRRFPTILDAGCGHGWALRELDKRFAPDSLIGVDLDSALLQRARIAASGCSCSIDLRRGDVAKLDIHDASLDMVFCHQTLHHVSDQLGTLREFLRVLKPSGLLVLCESCRVFTRSLLVKLLFRHPAEVQRTAGEYLDLLRTAGFRFDDQDIAAISPWWSKPHRAILERLGWRSPVAREPSLLCVVAAPDESRGRTLNRPITTTSSSHGSQ